MLQSHFGWYSKSEWHKAKKRASVGRPKLARIDIVKKETGKISIYEEDAIDRRLWRLWMLRVSTWCDTQRPLVGEKMLT